MHLNPIFGKYVSVISEVAQTKMASNFLFFASCYWKELFQSLSLLKFLIQHLRNIHGHPFYLYCPLDQLLGNSLALVARMNKKIIEDHDLLDIGVEFENPVKVVGVFM